MSSASGATRSRRVGDVVFGWGRGGIASVARATGLARNTIVAGLRELVISVDCKKKELVGEFKNGGREWQPKGTPSG